MSRYEDSEAIKCRKEAEFDNQIIRIALLQCQPVANKTEALQQLQQTTQTLKDQGVTLLITPEMYLTGYNIGKQACREEAEELDGPSLQQIRAMCCHYQMAMVVGFPQQHADSVYNSAVFIDESGEIRMCYQKTHLYGQVDRAQFSAGDSLCPSFEWHGWQFALAICYDIEFPEVARHAAINNTDVILVPTANMEPFTGVSQRIVPARAEENTLYIAYANYVGKEKAFSYCGLSCVCLPTGKYTTASAQQSAVLVADLSRSSLQQARQDITYLTDRRSDLY
jgi:predicted amidohydrolase